MELSPELIWGVFLRLLGAVHAYHYYCLSFQLKALIGPDGLLPIQEWVDHCRAEHGTVRGFFRIPTIFWLSGNNTMLDFFNCFGFIVSVALILGIYSRICVVILFVLYLSLTNAGGNFFMFPWDFFLTETTLLAIGVPSLHFFTTSMKITQPIMPLWSFAIRFVLIRLMLGFGIEKFYFPDAKTYKGTYIKRFLAWQPHPTPLAWYLQKLPLKLHFASEVGLFIVEVIVPLLFLLGFGWWPLHLLTALSVIGLQVGIQLSGNFGHFNLLSCVVAIPVLDSSIGWGQVVADFSAHPILGALLLIQELSGVFYLAHQLELGGVLAANWCGWLFADEDGPITLYGKPIPLWFLEFQRFITRFHIAHGYGVFRHTYPCTSLRIEGAKEETEYHWKPFGFHVYHQPTFSAPFQWRLDFMMRYESGGLSFALPIVSGINKYWQPNGARSLMVRLLKGLCNGNQTITSLFAHNPFEGGCPDICRVTIMKSKFTDDLKDGYWINDFDFYKTITASDRLAKMKKPKQQKRDYMY